MAAKATDKTRTKFLLDEKDIPTKWYNIQADFKTPAPPVLHPGTGQPIGPQDLAPLFPMELIKQEVSRTRWIEIPTRCATFSSSGARRRSSARAGSRKRSGRPRASTTSTRA